VEVGDDLAARQRPELLQREGERLGHRAADVERGLGGHRGILRAELAIRDWARRDHGVGDRLRRVDNRRMDYMRGLFSVFCPDPDEVEARCLVSMALFVGSHFVAAGHGTRSRRDVMDRALERLLV